MSSAAWIKIIIVVLFVVVPWAHATWKKSQEEQRRRREREREAAGGMQADPEVSVGDSGAGESLADIAARRRAELRRRAKGGAGPQPAPQPQAAQARSQPRPQPARQDTRLSDEARSRRDQSLRAKLAREEERARQAKAAELRETTDVHTRLAEESRGHLTAPAATATVTNRRPAAVEAGSLRKAKAATWRKALAMREVLDRPLALRGDQP